MAITWNPSDKVGVDLSNGDLTATSNTSGRGGVRATDSISNKKYWEIVPGVISSHTFFCGVANSLLDFSANYCGQTNDGWSYRESGNKCHNSLNGVVFGAAFTAAWLRMSSKRSNMTLKRCSSASPIMISPLISPSKRLKILWILA